MSNKDNITEEILRQYYLEENLPMYVIAQKFGVTSGVIERRIKKFGIHKPKKSQQLEARINVEDLKQYYIVENHSLQETYEHFECTGPQLRVLLNKLNIVKDRASVQEVCKRSCLKKYGVESINQAAEVKAKKRQVCLERYGVENPMQLEKFRNMTAEKLNTPEIVQKRIESLRNRSEEQKKASYEQAKNTMVERYGENYKEIFVSKSRETLMDKYGVPYSIPGHEKMKQTNLERYGVEKYRRSEDCKNKVKETKIKKYGGYFNQKKIAEVKQERYGNPKYNNREKAKNTMLEKYGVECYLISQDCYNKFKNDSKPNLAFAKLLTEKGIEFEREFPLSNRSFDFKVGDTLIEINPYATHNSTWGIRGGIGKDKNYHKDKSLVAIKNGYNYIFIWDWSKPDDIIREYLGKIEENVTVDKNNVIYLDSVAKFNSLSSYLKNKDKSKYNIACSDICLTKILQEEGFKYFKSSRAKAQKFFPDTCTLNEGQGESIEIYNTGIHYFRYFQED